MTVTVLPNTMVFQGIFNEGTTASDLTNAYEKLKANGITPPVAVDFSNVPYANSSGVVVWLRFVQEVSCQFKYVNAPSWLVKQFNMINGYFSADSYVESIQAQFFAPATRDSRTITLKLGKDVPILKDYSKFKVPTLKIDGNVYEMDFVPERFFVFIVENYDQFKGKFK